MSGCEGMAHFDSLAQAEYVADQEQIVSGGFWRVFECGHHWHVMEWEPPSTDDRPYREQS